jgi:hypothetical protein
MKKAFHIIILISFSRVALGQTNLVPNPGFESYNNCTYTVTFEANNWQIYCGSPDYYNTCANFSSPWFGVPSNDAGYQNAFEGNGYCGVALYCKGCVPNREYIGVQLTQTLSIGTKYFVSAYISRSDSSWGGIVCQSNNFGFVFSKTGAYSATSPHPTNNFSHVNSSTIIYDSLNWVKVGGSFKADSNYKFLSIGNFYTDANTLTSGCYNLTNSFSYYYIDKVCVSTDSMLCNIPTQLNEIERENSLVIYPNPASNFISIAHSQSIRQCKVLLIDTHGQIVLDKRTLTSNKIDITNVSEGLYFIQIIYNGLTYYDKIIIQR